MKVAYQSVLLGILLVTTLTLASSCRVVLPTNSSLSPFSPSPWPSVSLSPSGPPSLFPEDWDDLSIFRSGLVQSELPVLEGQNIRSIYHLDLQIAEDYLSLVGREEVRYTNTETVRLDAIYFQLFPNFSDGKTTVSGVSVDGQPVSYAYQSRDRAISVPLTAPLMPGDRATIRLNFRLQIPTTQAGNYGLFTYNQGILALDEFYPVIPVYDETGWRVLSELSPNSDKTYLDASLYLVRVTAPADLTLVASGSAVSEERSPTSQIMMFAAGPARDFYLAAGEFLNEVSQDIGQTKINSYAFGNLSNGATLALNTAARALGSYEKRLGDYPYTELDIVCLPMTAGALGIEYPGVAGISLDIYDNAQTMEPTVAHEVGHQWFYNLVGNDQISQPWLDEALTEYLTGLYYLDTYGQSGWQGYRQSWVNRWNRVNQAKIPIGLPSGDYTGREYGAIVYGRGPLFLEALSQTMGLEVFDSILQDYYLNKKWGIGTANYFLNLAETECSCNLTPLFSDWVFPN